MAEDKVTVTPLAANPGVYFPRDPEEAAALVAPRHAVRPPFILYTSRIEHPGKNHARLIRAFAELKRKEGIPHQLVLAGTDRERADEVHRVAGAERLRQGHPVHGVRGQRRSPVAVPGC